MNVSFGPKTLVPKVKTIDDVRKLIIDFLNQNGYMDLAFIAESTYIKNNQIYFTFDCANSRYTELIGCLLLVFSKIPDGAGYVEFRDGSTFQLTIINPDSIYKHIENNFKINLC